MTTKTYRVYGLIGHRQRESFYPSYSWDFSEGEKIRKITVENSDKTGTNDFTRVIITEGTAEECAAEIRGQVTDGIFENSRTGEVIDEETGEGVFDFCETF